MNETLNWHGLSCVAQVKVNNLRRKPFVYTDDTACCTRFPQLFK